MSLLDQKRPICDARKMSASPSISDLLLSHSKQHQPESSLDRLSPSNLTSKPAVLLPGRAVGDNLTSEGGHRPQKARTDDVGCWLCASRCGDTGLSCASFSATSSVAALLIGGGAPAAYAAACNNVVSAPFDNPLNTTIQNVCIDASFTAPGSNITNEGAISPSGIAFIGGTINGSVLSAGVINGGISLDPASMISGSHTSHLDRRCDI